MNNDKYLKDYEAEYQIKTPAEYDNEALTILRTGKQYWAKENAPKPKGLKGLLTLPKKQVQYEPQSYLYALIHAAAKNHTRMPYTALYQAVSGDSYAFLQNAIFQANRLNMLATQPLASGYDHCIGLPQVLYGLSSADMECIEKLFPYKNGLSRHGHTVLRAFTNMLMGLWYKDSDILKTGYEQSQKLTTLKSSKKQDISIAKYLMALADVDIDSALNSLTDICKSVTGDKGDSIIPYNKTLGQHFVPQIHGLVILAYFILGNDFFRKMLSFDNAHYCKQYIEYLSENEFPKPNCYVTFTDELAITNYMIANSPNSYVYISDKRLFVDTERYKKERANIVAEKFDLESYFRTYN